MINNKKILILGVGKSGLAAAKVLASNNEVIITDKKEQEEKVLEELKSINALFIKSEDGTNLVDDTIDLMVKNPGIEPNHPAVIKANSLNIKIVNEMEIAYSYIKDNTIIGITGSNGKTTTTTMIYDLLKLHNYDVVLGGNIGYPVCSILDKVNSDSILVLEISDHQLYNLDIFKTNISVLTNICPTHLDYHGNYENYMNTKKKIFNHHDNNDIAIINKRNDDSLKITNDILSTKKYFNNEDNYFNDEGIFINNELIININDIKIKGIHNYENILAALLVLNEFRIDKNIVKDYLSKFNGVEHRIEIVDSNLNIDFYNDSKATNPTATLTALNTMNKPTHLILGGMERKQDFHELDSKIDIVKEIYAIGETKDRIKEYADSINKPCIICDTLENAIIKIKENVKEGETVLLSTASASWDQYDKFETRGEEFKKMVEKYFN